MALCENATASCNVDINFSRKGCWKGREKCEIQARLFFLLLLLFLQEFIPSSPALHTGIALCTGCPRARTAQPQGQQVSALSSSHATCPRLRAHLTHVPVPTDLHPQQEGIENNWDPYTLQDLRTAPPGCRWGEIKASWEASLVHEFGGDPSEASFSIVDSLLGV